jgi:hypothetical protein
MRRRAASTDSRGGAGRPSDAEAHTAERRLLGLAVASGAAALVVGGAVVVLLSGL